MSNLVDKVDELEKLFNLLQYLHSPEEDITKIQKLVDELTGDEVSEKE